MDIFHGDIYNGDTMCVCECCCKGVGSSTKSMNGLPWQILNESMSVVISILCGVEHGSDPWAQPSSSQILHDASLIYMILMGIPPKRDTPTIQRL